MSIGSLQPLAPGSHSKIRRILASQRRTPTRKSSNDVLSPRLFSEISHSGKENRDIAHIAPRSRSGKNRDVAPLPRDPPRSAGVRRPPGWDRAGAIPVTAHGPTAGPEPATLRASVGSTEAAKDVVARFGVVGPKHPRDDSTWLHLHVWSATESRFPVPWSCPLSRPGEAGTFTAHRRDWPGQAGRDLSEERAARSASTWRGRSAYGGEGVLRRNAGVPD